MRNPFFDDHLSDHLVDHAAALWPVYLGLEWFLATDEFELYTCV
jgi:hypothetical protein